MRIFDYQRAIECYVDWLGFEIQWEHKFDDNTPVYMQLKKGDLRLHLSEHSGGYAYIYLDRKCGNVP